MDGKTAAMIVQRERHYLTNILKVFRQEHGSFKPVEGTMTVAQQIYHIAHTVHWFREGAFGTGFRMDFEAMTEEVFRARELDEAMDYLNRTYDEYIAFLESLTEEEIEAPLPDNPIFGNAPKSMIIHSTTDHTAHHRGSLAVYLRLVGVEPVMVYSE